MFDLYFAGADNPVIMDECKKLKVAKLFTNATERKWIEEFASDENFQGKLMVDSGAFTTHSQGKEMSVDDYIDFLNKNDDGIDWAIQVDKIPGTWRSERTREDVETAADQTWKNYLYMIQKVKSPKKLLPVYHFGEDLRWLKNMVEFKYSDGTPVQYICIGGSSTINNAQRNSFYGKCFELIEKSTNPNVKVHLLGCQSLPSLEKLPATSADATSWIRCGAFGSIMTKWGNILVSGVQEHSMDHALSMESVGVENLRKYVESFGFKLEDLIYDREEMTARVARLIFNMRYLKDWQDHYEYKGPKSFIRKSLF